ncbi:MAG: baseplate J/gp47 family protein [Candidatus Microgenomates bacterium]|jgi:hypothetical protein
MNLKDFLASREHPPELYWSLVIEEDWIQAGIWYIGETAAEVISVSSGAAWSTDEELLGAADAALSSAVQKLPEDYKEPNKTVFGVSASWVKGGEIKEEYLSKIKKLCAELSLVPVGFVVLPEAIAHLYKSEEGAPLSAVVLKLGEEYLEISVFKLGNLVGTTEVSRSVSLIEDVTEGLSRFEGAVPLPSRFVVYDGREGELEEAKNVLMQASWSESEKVKFLHTPKAEILSSDRKVLATSLAGAAEIGHVSQVASVEPQDEEKTEDNEELIEETVPPENMGFAIGEDVAARTAEIQNVVPPQPVIPVPSPKAAFNPAKLAGEYLAKSKNLFHSFSAKVGAKTPAAPRVKSNSWIIFLVLAVVAVIGAGVFWWFYPKAKITVFVTPKRFEQQVQVSFSPNGQFDAANGIIPAQVITDQVKGEKTKSATGTQLIGNRSTGSVQIANGNGAAINLSAGTILTSSAGLKFVTVSTASVSGQILPGSPGTANVDVSAGDIGAQYNLAKGEVFSVGNYSKALVAATSTADFSGGSSQEVSAVSKDDQTSLEADLKSELTQNAQSDISAKVSTDQIFVTGLAGLDTVSESFDHKVGDQADSLKLDLALNATGLAADKSKLLEYAKGVLNDKIPAGYSLSDSQIDFQFVYVGQLNGNYSYNVTVGANFLPQIDTQKVISLIAGKTPSVAQNYLDSIPGFGHAEVTINFKFPPPLDTLPRIPGNITLDVQPEQ